MIGSEVAIIGMAGRFPGAEDIRQFWDNLKNGKESISVLSEKEIDRAEISEELINDPDFVKVGGGILRDIEYFDAPFFGYSPREAELMDPQMRIFHECCWDALEDAGYNPVTYEGLIGMYAGASSSFAWKEKVLLSGRADTHGHFASNQLADRDFLSTRIAYNLNLRGPSFTLQTACSTSLVAVHLAVQGILNGECDMALAGGISIAFAGKTGYLYQEGTILSPDGHCRAFDARSKGTIYGEGVGIVVLKSLEDALSERDYIYAVIKGTAVNNDGKRKVGFTAPGIEGQADVIRVAQQVADTVPESISYLEAHGTGTELGDPVEIEALKLAFNTSKKGFCGIGSVKTNIGHLDAAAGTAGLIKTVLSLKHRQIPPSLHFEIPNPKIDFKNSPFYIVNRLMEWQAREYPRRAGVSSFGIGGTNAHVILEEAPEPVFSPASRKKHLLLLSARTQSSLDRSKEKLAKYLEDNAGINIADAAYTLMVGRKVFPYRMSLVCSDVDMAAAALKSNDPEKVRIFHVEKERKVVVFMFPGQGSQYANMGLDIYRTENVFRKEMDYGFRILKSLMGFDFKKILYPSLPSPSGNDERVPTGLTTVGTAAVDQTAITQPLIFIFEHALAKLLMKWGIKPDAMIGHSIGEYVAACISGVFSFEEALELVTLRGKLMQDMPAGSMLGVSLSEKELLPFLNHNISLAAVNSTSNCVVSGTHEEIESFIKKLKEKGYESTRLHTSHAFHSRMMDPVLEEFEKKFKEITLNKPVIPYISNLTGNWISEEEAVSPEYWTKHLRNTVRFSDGLEELLKEEDSIFLEIGPGKSLSSLLNKHEAKKKGQVVVNLIKHPQKDVQDDDYYFINNLGRVWLFGKDVDWVEYYSLERRYRIPLPGYSFERREFRIEGDPLEFKKKGFNQKNERVRNKDMSNWFYIPSWEQSILVERDLSGVIGLFRWLIFIDEEELRSILIDYVKQYTTDIVTVAAGPVFKKLSDESFIINPNAEDDYYKIFNELKKIGKIPGKILHFWGLTDSKRSELSGERLAELQDSGLFSLLNIVRAIGKLAISDTIQIDVITANMLDMVGGEVLYPEKATMLGAVKIVPLEYYNIKCRCVDLLVQDLESLRLNKNADLIHKLFLEFISDVSDIIVAYRGDYRWVQKFKPIYLDKNNKGIQRLREGGVYLITGGLGGMGFNIASFLAKDYRARLVLVNRSKFLPQEEWDDWLKSHVDENETSIKVRKLQEMICHGGDLFIASADTANYNQMKEVVERSEKKFGRIEGVIHTAGIADYDGVIQRRNGKMMETNMAAKVKGTIVLHDLFRDRELAFLMLFSSIGNVIYGGKFGQVGYNAANEFLDAYAFYKKENTHIYKTVINWCDWLEVGMTIKSLNDFYKSDPEKLKSELKSLRERAISPEEGVKVFSLALKSTFPRMVISPLDLNAQLTAMLHELENVETSAIERISRIKKKSGDYHTKPELGTIYIAPGNELESLVVNVWQEFFGYERIGINDNLFELGASSLDVVQVNKTLKELLNREIPVVVMFEYPTIKSFVRHLEEELNSTTGQTVIDRQEKLDKGKDKLKQLKRKSIIT